MGPAATARRQASHYSIPPSHFDCTPESSRPPQPISPPRSKSDATRSSRTEPRAWPWSLDVVSLRSPQALGLSLFVLPNLLRYVPVMGFRLLT